MWREAGRGERGGERGAEREERGAGREGRGAGRECPPGTSHHRTLRHCCFVAYTERASWQVGRILVLVVFDP